jgi:BA14K-like protein
MSISLRKLTAVVTAAAIASSASVATAMPFGGGLALKNAAPVNAEQVRWGGRGLGWGLGAGLLGGAIIGGLAAPRYYYGPGPYYYGPGPYYAPAPVYADPGYADPGSDPVAYCSARFRSYDPRSGTYLGYDGLRHPCP